MLTLMKTSRGRADLLFLPNRPTFIHARVTILTATIARGRIERILYKTTQNQGKGNGKVNVKAKETKVRSFDFSGKSTEPTENITHVLLFIKEFKNMGKYLKYSVYKLSFFQL